MKPHPARAIRRLARRVALSQSATAPSHAPRGWLAAIVLSAVISACGGGGGASDVASDGAASGTTTDGSNTGATVGGGNTAAGAGTPPAGSTPDVKEVVSGFNGDLAFFDASINNEGIGGGADGDGGVGIGGSLGRFRGAEVIVTYPDGSELGRAIVDDATGLVTARPGRTYSGPLLIEIQGRAGAVYYDEARQSSLPFPPGQRLRSRVSVVRGNIGVTPFTEAAASYQDANPGNGTLAQQIDRSHDVVRNEINQIAPSGYDIADTTRLPLLIDATTVRNSIPATDAGRYGLLLAALADLARAYNPTLSSPALAFSTQLAADLTDGSINGVQASGAPLAPEAQIAYSQPRLADQLVTSLTNAQQTYSDPATPAAAPTTVKVGLYSVIETTGQTPFYQARLLSDGRVLAEQLLSDGSLGPSLEVATDVRALFSGLDNFANGLALIMRRSDGSLIGLGRNEQPSFQFAESNNFSTAVAAAVPVPALGDLKMVGYGSTHQVGLRQDGTVVAWGDNAAGQLADSGGSPSAIPQPVSLPASARAVAGTANVSIAVLNDGTVFTWGGDNTGALGQGEIEASFAPPGHVITASGALLDGVVAVQTCFRTTVAVRSDGSVWAWGDDELGLLGNGDATNLERAFAAPIDGLPPVRKVVMGFDGAYALTLDGRIFYWGLQSIQGPRAPVAQVAGISDTRDLLTLGTGEAAALNNAGDARPMRFGIAQ
ncbi:MAG: hypothetical protein R3E87_08285 [Burkholderiaceae bacterium]